jgi:hypothetical protein
MRASGMRAWNVAEPAAIVAGTTSSVPTMSKSKLLPAPSKSTLVESFIWYE